jgi:hypothetical protein
MDLAPLELTPEAAAERLKAYEAQLADERTAEDDAIRAGYRAAARGLPVIALSDVIARGGYFANGLPRLAIARADATTCWLRIDDRSSRRLLTYRDEEWDRGRARVGRHRVAVDVPRPQAETNRPWRASTIVPSIPPDVRPRRQRLWRFHVLWEVERWDPTPPRDPALLRHIRSDLWSVVATWDLTDLERAVLTARRS